MSPMWCSVHCSALFNVVERAAFRIALRGSEV